MSVVTVLFFLCDCELKVRAMQLNRWRSCTRNIPDICCDKFLWHVLHEELTIPALYRRNVRKVNFIADLGENKL